MSCIEKILFLLVVGLFYGCTVMQGDKKKSMESDSMVYSLRKERLNAVFSKEGTFFYENDTISTKIGNILPFKNDEYCVYIANTDCSHCLAQFFDFLTDIDNIEGLSRVYGIINEASKPTVEYYIEECGIKKDNVILVEDVTPCVVNHEEFNGFVLHYKDNKLLTSFFYSQLSRE